MNNINKINNNKMKTCHAMTFSIFAHENEAENRN